jgi:hypothetical protein
MSSVQDKSASDEKTTTFFRRESFQKLKCTAFQPLQMAGEWFFR